ncbi:MAG: TraR/DksA C4-type zinc finger protein [Candidatus Nealsonbacteria bacterium]
MDKKLIEELKIKLETERKDLENNLKSFATKDDKLKDDWDTKFPNWEGETGGAALEKGADQVEQYGNMLGVEHSLEAQLKDVNKALEKIEKGTYGKCENCEGYMPEERLKVFPSAKICIKCEGK